MNLYSKLYTQRKFVNKENKTIYNGEDAFPYAKDGIIIVADGLGGRGGFPHLNVNKNIIDKDNFYDLVFKSVFVKEVDDEFKEFVVNSCNEIFITKDYYFDNYKYAKPSGYFASRLATAISLYELKYNEEFNKDNIFNSIKDKTEDEKNAIALQYGEKLQVIITEKLQLIAKDINLILESRISGKYLLPTTLTIALVNENESSVDVLYLWAGDSRGYFIDKDGLGLITADHEVDEEMYNRISLTLPYKIEGRFVTINKPCILFNASDGVYKCSYFDSPFKFEYWFFKTLLPSNNINPVSFEDSEKSLANLFDQIGTHDDSNTYGLITYGFENFEDVQKLAQDRLNYINETIINKLPDIINAYYDDELRELEKNKEEVLEDITDESIDTNLFIEDEKCKEYIKNQIINSEEYKIEIDDLNKKIEDLKSVKNEIKEIVIKFVKYNWFKNLNFRRFVKIENYKLYNRYLEKIECFKKIKRANLDERNKLSLKIKEDEKQMLKYEEKFILYVINQILDNTFNGTKEIYENDNYIKISNRIHNNNLLLNECLKNKELFDETYLDKIILNKELLNNYINDIITNHKELIPEKAKCEKPNSGDEKYNELINKINLRSKLYEEYYNIYMRMYKGAQI